MCVWGAVACRVLVCSLRVKCGETSSNSASSRSDAALAGYRALVRDLRDFGWHREGDGEDEEEELHALAGMLWANDVRHWAALRPLVGRAWPGSEVLTERAMSFLQFVIERGQATPCSPQKPVRELVLAPVPSGPAPVVRVTRRGKAKAVVLARTGALAHGVGPRKALAKLDLESMTDAARTLWIEDARIEAILGATVRTLPSVRSGLTCFAAFVGECARVWGGVCLRGCGLGCLCQIKHIRRVSARTSGLTSRPR